MVGLRFGHVVDQLVDALGVVDLRADRDRQELAGRVLVGMRQRQEGQEHVVADADFQQQAIGALDVAEDRAVGQHHALRHAAGAGGVDDAAGLVARQRADPAVRSPASSLASPRLIASPQVSDAQRQLLRLVPRLHRDQEAELRRLHRRRQQARLAIAGPETMTPLAPLWVRTWRLSSTVLVAKAGTVMAPTAMIARSAISHSGRFSAISADPVARLARRARSGRARAPARRRRPAPSGST